MPPRWPSADMAAQNTIANPRLKPNLFIFFPLWYVNFSEVLVTLPLVTFGNLARIQAMADDLQH